MKTDKQISNAHTRAASLAHAVATLDQSFHFAADAKAMSEERGAAMNAAGFAASALAHLENGEYDQFLTCMSLAGDFVKDARLAHSLRTPVTR